MECRRVESLLPPYVDGEACAADAAEVERHLATCAACRSAVAAQRTARTVLRARGAALAPAVPPELRRRIAAMVPARPSRGRVWRGRVSALAAAAAASVLLVAGFELLSLPWNVVYAAQLAIDHVRCFIIEAAAQAPVEPETLEHEFADRDGWLVEVPASNDAIGLTLVAARRCPFWLGRHAHVLYRIHDRELSLYIDPGDRRDADRLHVLGHTQYIWQSGGSAYALIARGVPDEELTEIAAYFRSQTHARVNVSANR